MPRIVIELTNRCNLSCGHCFDERHAATGDLSWGLRKGLREGKGCGIEQLSFTGGEPTIHRRFKEIIQRVAKAGYRFSFVSNGVSFPRIYPLLLKHRRWFVGATFSLDGAREETHDRLRGKGSYRRVMRAASICVVKELPFTLNMVLTAQNRKRSARWSGLRNDWVAGSAFRAPDADAGDRPAQAGFNAGRETRGRIANLGIKEERFDSYWNGAGLFHGAAFFLAVRWSSKNTISITKET